MGLKNNESNVSYLKFKDGKFFSSRDKETGYNEIEGYIKNFTLADQEFKGETDRKLTVAIIDEEGDTYLLQMSLKTSYVTSLVSFLKNADLTEKLSLVGTSKTGDDGVVRNSILVKQDGKFSKGFYTKDNPNGMPKMKEVIINKKKVWDKSDMLEFIENVIVTELTPKVSKRTFESTKKVVADTLANVKEPLPDPVAAGADEDDDDEDLPF